MNSDTIILITSSHEANVIGAIGFVVILASFVVDAVADWIRNRRNKGGRA